MGNPGILRSHMQRERKKGLVSLRAARERERERMLREEGREPWRSCWTEKDRARSSVKSSNSGGWGSV